MLLAVACGLLFSLVPMGLFTLFILQRTAPLPAVQPAPRPATNAWGLPIAATEENRSSESPLAVAKNLTTAAKTPSPEPVAEVVSPPTVTALRPAHSVAGLAESVEIAPKRTTDLADLIETIESSVVRVNTSGPSGSGLGSGFVADESGTVVTNHHVIEGAATAEVVFKDGRTARVRGVLGDWADRDVALLAIEPLPGRKPKPLKIAETLPRKGEQVVAFGAPLGFSFTASDGLVSAIRNGAELTSEFRGLGFNLDYDSRVTWLQTTAPISRGNSGGPLVNVRGEVVGLNTLSIPELGQNLNFAVSAPDLLRSLDSAADEPRPLVPGTRRDQRPPAPRGGRPSRNEIADGVDTPLGRRLLAQLREVALGVVLDNGDPLGTRRNPHYSAQMIANQCTQSLNKLGLQVVDQPGPDTAILVVRAQYERGMNTSVACKMYYTLLERNGPGTPLVRTWTLDREVAFDTRYPTQVRRIPNDVKASINQLATAIREAQAHPGKPAPPPRPGARPPTPEDLGPPAPAPGQ